MKRLLIIFGLATFVSASYAECPTGWVEVPMENFTITESDGTCAAGTTAYYTIDSQCNANVL